MSVALVFKTQNLIEGGSGTNGRCLGLCAEWALRCYEAGGVINHQQLNYQTINNAQKIYEQELKSETLLFSQIFQMRTREVERLPYNEGLVTRRKILEMIIDTLRHSPQDQSVIIGLVMSRGKNAHGHALGWRKFSVKTTPVKPHQYYEFLDPEEGLWRSNDEECMMTHIENLLTKEYSRLLPHRLHQNHLFVKFFLRRRSCDKIFRSNIR